jgi:uncharacterized protein (DUF427 family)
MEKKRQYVRISLRSTGTVLAEGSKGWNMMPFEGNFYTRAHCMKTCFFRLNFVPGICPYKGCTSGWIFVFRTSRSQTV